MVAVTQLIPTDPEEQRTVLAVLNAHPALRGFIARASSRAEELFPGATIRLDTVQYDEWDPPVRLVIEAPVPKEIFHAQLAFYLEWLLKQPDFDDTLVFVLPLRVPLLSGSR